MDKDVAHFVTLSVWESREAIAAFAGADIEVTKYYPKDEKYLLEFEPHGHAPRIVPVSDANLSRR